MEKKSIILISAIVLLLISVNMDGVKSDASDCYDACSTGCVSYLPDNRRIARCDRKCQIRCSSGGEANGQH